MVQARKQIQEMILPQQTLQQFFAAKSFEIPRYQRSYSWEKTNIRELYDDLVEGMQARSSHYIGTIVLAKSIAPGRFFVVDGQQRLTSIILFISLIIRGLKDVSERDYWTRYYVKSPTTHKLEPLARDAKFYFQLLSGANGLEPQSKSQRCLRDAYEEMQNIVKTAATRPEELLEAFGGLEILEFVENDKTDAIRIFQTVNDRGKELSRMDKIKSLLFYFSTKYCEGIHNESINEDFAEIFELYDNIKSTAELEKINVISSKQFNEDDLLRHHHVCFSEESYDPSGQWVLDNVRSKLSGFRAFDDRSGLSKFIGNYLSSLLAYVRAFASVIARVTHDPRYYKIFVVQGFSATLYPVITMLEKNDWLEAILPNKDITMIELMEVIDLRVMKVRQYGGRKEISRLSIEFNSGIRPLAYASGNLIAFNSSNISNDRFRDYISGYDYSAQTGLIRALFVDLCERMQGRRYDITQLRRIIQNEPTIEHILSQTPNFKPRAFGFRSEEDFEECENLIGNLTLLEKKINSSIGNQNLSEKIVGYGQSKFKMTSELASVIGIELSFKKDQLKKRTDLLATDFTNRWHA